MVGLLEIDLLSDRVGNVLTAVFLFVGFGWGFLFCFFAFFLNILFQNISNIHQS